MTLAVVVVYPDLLGTYGDGGNGLVLAQRARWRGIDAELIEAPSGTPLPSGDLYCLGGGEDGPQLQAADQLRRDGTLLEAAQRGVPVLAVCAGYQIVGSSFPAADGRLIDGVGLLDVATRKGVGRRAVGEVVAEPLAADLPTLTGFENHGGVTSLGPTMVPFAKVTFGVGNGDGSGSEGACSGHVIGTYLHGPALARNPAVADLLLGWAIRDVLAPLDDHEEAALRAARLSAVRRRRPR